jgi:hypothetical protein
MQMREDAAEQCSPLAARLVELGGEGAQIAAGHEVLAGAGDHEHAHASSAPTVAAAFTSASINA